MQADAPARPLVEARGLVAAFPVASGLFARRQDLIAVNDVSLSLAPRETVGLVGESGCGKSTTGRLILNLDRPTRGRVFFDGADITDQITHDRSAWRALRRDMQIIFQDPFAAFNPRLSIRCQIAQVIKAHRTQAEGGAVHGAVERLLADVGLNPRLGDRYPHQLSGGQLQRALIARALAPEPRFIVCDEAVSALDVSVQAQIINLLKRLQRERGLTYLFISHNLSVVKHMSDRVAVMYLGRIVEQAPRRRLFTAPKHPYTRALIAAVPHPDPRRSRAPIVGGDPPSPINPPSGCAFHPRCPSATMVCRTQTPQMRRVDGGHDVACHHAETTAEASPLIRLAGT